jgi:hypothetical protein
VCPAGLPLPTRRNRIVTLRSWIDQGYDSGMTLNPTTAQVLDELPPEVVLQTVPVLVRLRSDAADERAAVADVTARLEPVRGLYDEVLVERQEDDGSFFVVGRFVTVSVDVHTAVVGVTETLAGAGVPVDEVWAAF